MGAGLMSDPLADALEELTVKLGELLPSLPLDDARVNEVIALLHERDRIERELVLASDEATSARMTFDRIVRPHVWRLVALNDVRREMTAKLTPEERARFYWWSEGSAIDPRAATAMSGVAHLVATFPGARRRFDALVQAQESWTSSPERVRTRARRLHEFLTPRRVRDDLTLAAAPTDGDERTVLTTRDVEVSFAAGRRDLIVDLLSDRRVGAVPWIVMEDGERTLGEAVHGAEERFRFLLSMKALDSTRLVIVVPLASGDLELVLPPSDPSQAPPTT